MMMMSRGGTNRVANTAVSVAKGLSCEVGGLRAFYGGGVRSESTMALSEKEKKVGLSSDGGNKEQKEIVSYWGVEPSKITKLDGTEWKWNCFRVYFLHFLSFPLQNLI